MQLGDSNRQLGAEAETLSPGMLSDDALESAIQAQLRSVEDREQAFARAREQLEVDRRRLRLLQQEQDRRKAPTADVPAAAEPAPAARRRRSSTAMDLVAGRGAMPSEAPFAAFTFRSLQRQEIILNGSGDRAAQAIAFIDKATGAMLEAHSFGEAHQLLEAGHALGRPGVLLQRQAVWYAERVAPGWLRLDQVFVEPRAEAGSALDASDQTGDAVEG